MEKPLITMIEKVSEIEDAGILIQEMVVNGVYDYDEVWINTITGKERPIGTYYEVKLTVLVPVKR